jgi:hypothetical protein
MNEIRIYRRRPSCLVRYRHGGYSAVFPMLQRYHAVNILTAKTGTGSLVAPGMPPGESENVLAFPGHGETVKRPQAPRTTTPRTTGRPSGRSSKGRPPKT